MRKVVSTFEAPFSNWEGVLIGKQESPQIGKKVMGVDEGEALVS